MHRRILARFSLAALMLSCATLRAQLNRGAIEGAVTDPEGAFVPGAKVTMSSVDTGVSVATTTNGAGTHGPEEICKGLKRLGFLELPTRSLSYCL